MKSNTPLLFAVLRATPKKNLNSNQALFYQLLPERFTTAQALQISSTLCHPSTAKEYLSYYCQQGYLAHDLDPQGRPLQGHYHKVSLI